MKNEYGYTQKGNRYFIHSNFIKTGTIATGFKSKKQFNEWLNDQFEIRGLDWRSGYTWKFRDSLEVFHLVDCCLRNIE